MRGSANALRRESYRMDERLRFCGSVAGWGEDGGVCQKSISPARPATRSSRATKYSGDRGTDRPLSTAPIGRAKQTGVQVEKLIVQLDGEQTSWGAPKIREKLRRLHTQYPYPPSAPCTRCWIGTGWRAEVEEAAPKPKAPVYRSPPHPTTVVHDYKGEFMLADKTLLLSAHHHRLSPAATSCAVMP